MLREKFNYCTINIFLKSLIGDYIRLSHLGRHVDSLRIKLQLLSILPDHVREWQRITGNNDYRVQDFLNPEELLESLLRGLVALLDEGGIRFLGGSVAEINEVTRFVNSRAFATKLKQCREDIEMMRFIYGFVNAYPHFSQKHLVDALEIDEYKGVKLLEMAEDMGCLCRSAEDNTWMLSLGRTGQKLQELQVLWGTAFPIPLDSIIHPELE